MNGLVTIAGAVLVLAATSDPLYNHEIIAVIGFGVMIASWWCPQ